MKALSIILILFLTFHKSIKCDSMLDSGFDADFYGDLTEFSCEDNYCNIIDLIGPPPDMILDIPPPPIPSFLKGLNILNESENLDKCNHCNQFTDNSIGGLGFTLPKQSSNLFTLNSITISIGLAVISSFLLIAIYIKYKRMKISMSDTCAGFSSSFFFKNKDLQVNSRVDNCAPVVNEKTSQSIITNSPSKKSTIIPAKYWKTPTGNGINFVHPNNHLMVNEFNGCGLIDSTMTTEMGEYLQEEGGSCTSSPVYQSPIYADSNNHQINLENMSNLITLNSFNQLNSQPIRYKSYTMRNYSDIPNSIQINQLNQINPDTALLPDVSYDNEAYLPSSNSSDYHNKSLKKMMKSSKTPLLSTHSNVNHSLTLGYHLGNDKPKQTFIQHQLGTQLNRMSVNNTLMLGNHDQDQLNHQQPRYVQSGINKKNSLLIYNGQPIISNTSTFQQKRPLPNIPKKQNFI